jgi:hypothetical protein
MIAVNLKHSATFLWTHKRILLFYALPPYVVMSTRHFIFNAYGFVEAETAAIWFVPEYIVLFLFSFAWVRFCVLPEQNIDWSAHWKIDRQTFISAFFIVGNYAIIYFDSRVYFYLRTNMDSEIFSQFITIALGAFLIVINFSILLLTFISLPPLLKNKRVMNYFKMLGLRKWLEISSDFIIIISVIWGPYIYFYGTIEFNIDLFELIFIRPFLSLLYLVFSLTLFSLTYNLISFKTLER